MVKVSTNYYGEIEVNESDILTIKGGLIGFEDYTKFILLKEDDIFVEYLQCIDDKVSFAIMDPLLLNIDYKFEVSDDIVKELQIETPDDVVVKTILVIPEDITKIRTNLQAPIVFNKKINIGKQIILDDSFPVRYEFYNMGGK